MPADIVFDEEREAEEIAKIQQALESDPGEIPEGDADPTPAPPAEELDYKALYEKAQSDAETARQEAEAAEQRRRDTQRDWQVRNDAYRASQDAVEEYRRREEAWRNQQNRAAALAWRPLNPPSEEVLIKGEELSRYVNAVGDHAATLGYQRALEAVRPFLERATAHEGMLGTLTAGYAETAKEQARALVSAKAEELGISDVDFDALYPEVHQTLSRTPHLKLDPHSVARTFWLVQLERKSPRRRKPGDSPPPMSSGGSDVSPNVSPTPAPVSSMIREQSRVLGTNPVSVAQRHAAAKK